VIDGRSFAVDGLADTEGVTEPVSGISAEGMAETDGFTEIGGSETVATEG
jgi:hypothetical protein